jgi:superfamily II DNA or RNA helicase
MTELSLRAWQERFLAAHGTHYERDFLLVATPGAGKTTAAAVAISEARSRNGVEQVIVVCPTRPLRRQWATSMHRHGLELDPNFRNSNGRWAADMDGVSVTYQQVAAQPDLFALHVGHRPTAVVLDELHHAADDSAWGGAIAHAFERARLRLALSGTPFRSDNNAIPFVRYDERGRCCPDFIYSYAEAIEDGVCRPVAFRRHGGTMRWYADGVESTASFDDPLDRLNNGRRLRTAIAADKQYLKDVLANASSELERIRAAGSPRAGGLVIADDQNHARAIARLLESTVGEQPEVAISDDPRANETIHAYAASDARWLVAVSMVSEGIDIPRLAVQVYATCRRTDLFFRQAVGRVVRRLPSDPSGFLATVFIPADPTLTALAERIEAEIRHELRPTDEPLEEIEASGIAHRSDFSPLSAQAIDEGAIIAGIHYTAGEVAAVDQLIGQTGLDPSHRAELLHFGRQARRTNTRPKRTPDEAQAKHERVAALKTEINGLVDRWVRFRNTISPFPLDHRAANTELNAAVGVRSRNEATEQQLERALNWLHEMNQGLDRGWPDVARRINAAAPSGAVGDGDSRSWPA